MCPNGPDPGETASASQPGARPFQLLSQLGAGGMGEVWRARWLADGREVAVKTLLPGAGNEARRRFAREIRALAALSDPHLPRVIGAQSEGEPWLAMELISGRDLRRLVEADGPLPPQRAAALLAPVAEALAACHAAGLVHRDVKPSNIVIERGSGRAVLIDFGIVGRAPNSVSLSRSGASLTQTGQLLGTPHFMAPEQLAAKEEGAAAGAAVDAWGLGATLFFALTGRSPLELTGAAHLLAALAAADLPRLRSADPRLPAAFDELCARCLSRDPASRPSLEDLADELSDLASGLRRAPRLRPAALIAALTLSAAALATALLALPRGDPTAPAVTALELPATTRLPEVTWTARAEGAVTLERRSSRGWREASTHEPGEDGRLGGRLQLSPGRNSFRFSPRGRPGQPVSVEVGFDTEPPVITIAGGEGELLELLGPRRLLSGQVRDESPTRLELDGEPLSLGPQGRFQRVLDDVEAARELTLVATDSAGNVTERRLRVLTDAGLAAWVARLDELASWDASTELEQDRIIREVAARLGPDYAHTGTQRYASGGATHRIATFTHRPTGAALRLLPGAWATIGCRDIEAVRAETEANLAHFLMHISTRYDIATILESARPLRRIRIPPLLMGACELTRAQWEAVTANRAAEALGVPAQIINPAFKEDPVLSAVSYEESVAWLRLAGGGLRLPSEAEWEYACRAGTETPWSWGARLDDSQLSYSLRGPCGVPEHGGATRPPPLVSPGDEARANAFGLVDMHGGWAEWCADTWAPDLRSLPDDGSPYVDRSASQGGQQVQRGGAQFWPAAFSASAARMPSYAYTRIHTSLRLARSVPRR